jgi:hypothetical protein
VSAKTGRNDPCPCGSGKKYKKCCLDRDEAERRELSQSDLAFGGDPIDDEDSTELEEWEDHDLLPEPLTAEDIVSIGYSRGMVKSRRRALAGEGLSAKEWIAPRIPEAILTAIEREGAAELDGSWGDPGAASPIEVDVIDIETPDDVISIEVFNRGVLLVLDNSDEVRRVHRLCEVLRTSDAPAVPATDAPDDAAEPARRSADAAPPIDFEQFAKAHRNQPGTCALCGTEVRPTNAAKHLKSCAPEHDAPNGPPQTLLHLRVTVAGSPYYWLDVEIRDDAPLKALDQFLRRLWVECCGHLSQFTIGNVDYASVKSEEFGWPGHVRRRVERSMSTRVREAVPAVGERFTYEYDFGTTTELTLTVKGARLGSIGRPTTRLLARNSPIAWPCAECGEPAAFVCAACVAEEENPFACERHSRRRHRCGETGMFLPVVNSPRMGVCGYTGEP